VEEEQHAPSGSVPPITAGGLPPRARLPRTPQAARGAPAATRRTAASAGADPAPAHPELRGVRRLRPPPLGPVGGHLHPRGALPVCGAQPGHRKHGGGGRRGPARPHPGHLRTHPHPVRGYYGQHFLPHGHGYGNSRNSSRHADHDTAARPAAPQPHPRGDLLEGGRAAGQHTGRPQARWNGGGW